MKTMTTLLRPLALVLLFLVTASDAGAQTTCNASFTYTTSGNTVTLTSTSTGVNNNTFYMWTYGQSGYAYGQNTTITVNQSGNYIVCLYISDSLQSCSDQFCDTITVTLTGIADHILPVDVKATPNPFGDKLQVAYTLASASPVTISITDMLGREVIKQDIETQAPGAQINNIGCSLLALGTYMLQVKTDYGKTTQLLIKN